jgi:hypothetical protein
MEAINKIVLKEENIAGKIFLIRGERVMLDNDIAQIYEVTTSRLNEQVKRNIQRFPSDFMFEFTQEEFDNLKSQFATSSWGGRRRVPFLPISQLVSYLKALRIAFTSCFL